MIRERIETRLIRLLALLLIWGSACGLAKGQAQAAPLEIVGFGDSLMAGYELPQGDGFPAVLAAILRSGDPEKFPHLPRYAHAQPYGQAGAPPASLRP